MEALKSPRFWLLVVVGLGVVALVYVMFAASVQPGKKAEAPASVFTYDKSLLTGELADFYYAYPPRPAPTASFEYAGEPMTLADFEGKVVLVNFWASTCAPCLRELPSLDNLEAKYGGKDFQVVAIASDPRGPETARKFLDRLEIRQLKLYADPQLSMAFAVGGANVLPVSILYARNGDEIGRIVGEVDWQSDEAHRLIESALGA